MDKREVIDLLEMDQIEFSRTIIRQIQDNLDDVDQLNKKAYETGNDIDIKMVLHEVSRLAKRHESLFNLVDDLLSKAEDNIHEVLEKVYKFPEVKDE